MTIGDITPVYADSYQLTAALHGLASSTTFLAGIETSVIEVSDLYDDFKVAGYFTTGTSPTANREFRLYAVPQIADGVWPDVFDGTASAETITHAAILGAVAVPLVVIPTDSTSDRRYPFAVPSLKRAFGGTMPEVCVLYATHNTGAASNATEGNHGIFVTPMHKNVAAS